MKPNRYFRLINQRIISGVSFGVPGVAILFDVSSSVNRFDLFVPGVILGASLLVLAFRAARAGAVSTNSGLLIRNLFRTIKLGWDEITRFELGKFKFTGLPVVVACLSNSRTVPLGSFCALFPNAIVLAKAERVVAALNSELRSRTAQ